MPGTLVYFTDNYSMSLHRLIDIPMFEILLWNSSDLFRMATIRNVDLSMILVCNLRTDELSWNCFLFLASSWSLRYCRMLMILRTVVPEILEGCFDTPPDANNGQWYLERGNTPLLQDFFVMKISKFYAYYFLTFLSKFYWIT